MEKGGNIVLKTKPEIKLDAKLNNQGHLASQLTEKPIDLAERINRTKIQWKIIIVKVKSISKH